MLTSVNLRPVDDDELIEPEPTIDRTRIVTEMVSNTAATLKNWIESMRKIEADLETDKSAACTKFDEDVAIAKANKEMVIERADASLRQLRETIKELEPARASLAEKAK